MNIVGTGEKDSKGLVVNGYDNTFTNMKIAKVFVGVEICSGGNMLRNIHPLYIYGNEISDAAYEESVAFLDSFGDNFYDYCYSDQYATGFYVKSGGKGVISDVRVREELLSDDTYKNYLKGKILSVNIWD